MGFPSCLLVVGVQTGYMSAATAGLPAKIRGFCETNQFEHRIFTRFVNPGAGSPFVEILNWKGLQQNAEIALVPELVDLPTLVIDQHGYSPFLDSKLENALREREVREVLVCGIDTDICVLATASGLFDRGFHPIVATDLSMSTWGSEYHEWALRILSRKIGSDNVVNTNNLTPR